jgi:hypothetical protein
LDARVERRVAEALAMLAELRGKVKTVDEFRADVSRNTTTAELRASEPGQFATMRVGKGQAGRCNAKK